MTKMYVARVINKVVRFAGLCEPDATPPFLSTSPRTTSGGSSPLTLWLPACHPRSSKS